MKLSEYLRKNCITQSEFAEKIGVAEATVCRWVNNNNLDNIRPSVRMMRKIIEETENNVTVDDWS